MIIGIKIEPGSCVRNPKAKGGLMHLTAEGRRPESVRETGPETETNEA